jgi:hypothetical protein
MKLKDLHESVGKSIFNAFGTIESPAPKLIISSRDDITSLDGSPEIVEGAADVANNKLTSLKGGPKEVGGSFSCSKNLLTSLKGGPKKVGTYYYCSNNKITSLEGAPETITRDFFCHDNALTSLVGAPKYIKFSLEASSNALTSLEGIHKQIKSIGVGAYFGKNPITSHVLGLMLIEDLQFVEFDNKQLQNIINKHLKEGRDVFECQNELMEAGLDEYAQL